MQVPFTLENINKLFGEVKKSLQGDARNAAHYIGRLATNYARETKGYDDQTGNLTNSINYAVGVGGQVENVVNAEQNGDHPVARENSNQFAETVEAEPGKTKLVVYAGMEYGLYVEARGYDVISQSLPKIPELIMEAFENGRKEG